MPVRRLVRLAGMFGINENQARVALSRMVARGEVATDGSGDYVLSGGLLARSARLAAARAAATNSFDGQWHVVVVLAGRDTAAVRQQRRAVLRLARLGEVRDGVWTRPANLAVTFDAPDVARLQQFLATPLDDPVALAAKCFDLLGWARRASHLLEELNVALTKETDSLAAGFQRNAEVLRHLQRDPLLPTELLPARWPGDALRARFDDYDRVYRGVLADAHRAAAKVVSS
jgi:phenylacetic acid degradation operon negative regulatory protein